MRLGGTLVTYNCIEHDYCFRESLTCLLRLCQEVCVCDAESTDGTREALLDIARDNKHLKVVSKPWAHVHGGGSGWLDDLGDFARSHLVSPYHLALQADEAIHEEDYFLVRALMIKMPSLPVSFRIISFWDDAQHEVQPGIIGQGRMSRFGLSTFPFSHGAADIGAAFPPIAGNVRIFHYGYLRRIEALRKKGIMMEEAHFGIHNPLWERVPTEGRKPYIDYVNKKNVMPWYGRHPKIMTNWLKERGYAT